FRNVAGMVEADIHSETEEEDEDDAEYR
ncbi:hypothetical protein Tco_1065969, partial [Tanacetum coccineum]